MLPELAPLPPALRRNHEAVELHARTMRAEVAAALAAAALSWLGRAARRVGVVSAARIASFRTAPRAAYRR